MAIFVLVHGTGHGGWCWQKVTPLLRAAGCEGFAPTLTGLGDQSHLRDCGVDLMTHITDIASLLFYEDISDVVLVGHSYAGMVITGVAATIPQRLRLLVYLDAYIPNEGQSEIDLWPIEMRAKIFADEAAGGGLRPPPTPAFLGITNPEMVDWVKARITPHPLATYTQPAPIGSAESDALRRVYISCTAGPTISLFGRFAAKARACCWEVHEIATGHDAMLTAPNDVAELLLEIAGGHT